MSDVEIIVKAIDLASPNVKLIGANFDALKGKVKGIGDGLTGASNKIASFASGAKNALVSAGEAWNKHATAVNQTLEILGKVGQAAQQAYQFISEGTQLATAERQFAALSSSIGSTSDALLGELKTATRGTISDFDLMKSATSIMSLGLADTSEETVRLSALVGKLGWDMNQVTLTLANQSTMRLDALGLSVTDVTDRVDALKAAGYSADQAFKFAILEAGEEKVKLLGDAADTTAGQLKILEANAANVGDSFKKTFSQEFIANLNAISGGLFEAEEGASKFGETLAKIVTNVSFAGFIRFAKAEIADLGNESKTTEGKISGMGGVIEELPPDLQAATRDTTRLADVSKVYRDDVIAATAATDGWSASLNTVTTYTEQALQAIRENASAVYQSSDAYAELQERIGHSEYIQSNAAMIEVANARLVEWGETIPTVTGYIAKSAEAMDAFTASTGQYFMAAAQAGDSLGFFNENLADLGTTMVATTVSIGNNESDLELLQDAYDKTANKLDKYRLGIEGATLSEEERAEKMGELQGQMASYQAQMDALGGSVTTYSQRTIEATINQDAVNQSLIESIAAAGGSAAEIGAAALALGTMSEAQVEAAMKAAELEIRIAGVRQAYLDGRLSADELTGAIQQQIEIVNGMAVSVNDATGDVSLLGDSMFSTSQETQTLLDKFGMFPDEISTTVNVDTGEAEARVANLYNKLRELGDPAMPTGGGTSGGSSSAPTGGGGNIPQYAEGGSFIVPPGYPSGQPGMTIGVHSGEQVNITPAGQPAQGGNTYNLYVTAMDGGANVKREFNYMQALAGG